MGCCVSRTESVGRDQRLQSRSSCWVNELDRLCPLILIMQEATAGISSAVCANSVAGASDSLLVLASLPDLGYRLDFSFDMRAFQGRVSGTLIPVLPLACFAKASHSSHHLAVRQNQRLAPLPVVMMSSSGLTPATGERTLSIGLY